METDLAYAAGIIDGEGSIMILRRRAGYAAWTGRVSVDMTESNVPDWLFESFGGSIHDVNVKPGMRPRKVWNIERLKAVAFLRSIRPYMKEKGEQAEVFIAFFEDARIDFCLRGRRGLDTRQIVLRDSYVRKLSGLKGRRRAAA